VQLDDWNERRGGQDATEGLNRARRPSKLSSKDNDEPSDSMESHLVGLSQVDVLEDVDLTGRGKGEVSGGRRDAFEKTATRTRNVSRSP